MNLPNQWQCHIEQKLAERQEAYLYRNTTTYSPISADKVQKDGRTYLMMASNNYLGLTHHPEVMAAAMDATKRYGTGSGGSRLISGSHPLFEELELALASFKKTEKALIFNTGYMANVAVITALIGRGDAIFSDALNHASIIDACRLSRGHLYKYNHKDSKHLEHLLAEAPEERKLIVTDGVFSMDGDIAPLDELSKLTSKYGALLMVDDAHATGVIGYGHGTAAHFHLEDKVHLQVGTLSKALASVGGFVAASKELCEYFCNFARPFIFSTALTPGDIGAALKALTLVEQEPAILQSLVDNQAYMTEVLKAHNMIVETQTPIFPIIVKESQKALHIARQLEEKGIILSAVRPPTVPVGESRLRLTVTGAHKKEDLYDVAATLGRCLGS